MPTMIALFYTTVGLPLYLLYCYIPIWYLNLDILILNLQQYHVCCRTRSYNHLVRASFFQKCVLASAHGLMMSMVSTYTHCCVSRVLGRVTFRKREKYQCWLKYGMSLQKPCLSSKWWREVAKLSDLPGESILMSSETYIKKELRMCQTVTVSFI